MSLLDVVAPDDGRGMRTMLAMMGGDPLPAAAASLLVARRRVVVATGFPVGGKPETDGPPGAIALCRALVALGCGHGVALASWRDVLDLCAPELPPGVELLDVRDGAIDGACVAIEACGTTADGSRFDMRGEDIRAVAPCFEDAVGERVLVAVGDGGNEVGMGSAPSGWHERFGVAKPRSTAEVLVPCSVSNWGALGLVAAMSALARTNVLPDPEEHRARIERLVARGAVDGFTGASEPRVDGRPVAAEVAVVQSLRTAVAAMA